MKAKQILRAKSVAVLPHKICKCASERMSDRLTRNESYNANSGIGGGRASGGVWRRVLTRRQPDDQSLAQGRRNCGAGGRRGSRCTSRRSSDKERGAGADLRA